MKLFQSPAFWIPLIVLLVAGALLVPRSRGERPWGFKDVVKDPGYLDRAAEARMNAEHATSLAKEWDDATVKAAVTAYLFDATSSRDEWVEKKWNRFRVNPAAGHRVLASSGRWPEASLPA